MQSSELTEQQTLKKLDASLRRKAKAQGFRLMKSRARDPKVPGYGTYGLVNVYTNFLELGDTNSGFGYCLEEIQRYLND